MPIVVRPLDALRGLAKYELVAGERRYLATRLAGQEHIPARILPLTDGQVLKAQLVENLQREGLDTLAEAAGYKELMALGVHADAIAAMIGKSRSYVYARTQLLDLSEPVKAALQEGEINASQALAFARVPAKLQEKALKEVERFGVETFRETTDAIRHKIFIELREAPFALDDAALTTFGPKRGRNQAQDVKPLPACSTCPKRSGNDAELLDALEGDVNVCTDRACYDLKVKAELVRRRARILDAGRQILTGDEAAAITPASYGARGGYQELDERCYQDTFPEDAPNEDEASPEYKAWEARGDQWSQRTYRQIIGDDVAQLELKVIEHKGRLLELAPIKDLKRLLKAHGIKARIQEATEPVEKPAKPENPEAAARRAEKEAREQAAAELTRRIAQETDDRLIARVVAAWKGPLKAEDLELIADQLLRDYEFEANIDKVTGGKRPTPATMSERDLGRLIICGIAVAEYDNNNDKPLRALCKRLKIDPKKIEKEVRVELTPKASATPKSKKGKK
jgi:ParB/RepB/Spo0J family partition protein